MTWKLAFAATLAILGSVLNSGVDAHSRTASATSWTTTLGADCRRCVAAASSRKEAPVPIPERAITYSFTGEFAHSANWWLLNLDTGEITKWEAVTNDAGERKTATTSVGTVSVHNLERVRAAAAALWRSKPHAPMVSPGAEEDDYVFSGSRLVAFDRFSRNDRDIVAAIECALPADARNTTGSFVVMQPKP